MPRPPMRETIKLSIPVRDANGDILKDKYGRPAEYKEIVTKCRVSYTTREIQGSDGKRYVASIEIDLPSKTPIDNMMKVLYEPKGRQKVEGQVISVDAAYNLAGTKEYYWTAYLA